MDGIKSKVTGIPRGKSPGSHKSSPVFPSTTAITGACRAVEDNDCVDSLSWPANYNGRMRIDCTWRENGEILDGENVNHVGGIS